MYFYSLDGKQVTLEEFVDTYSTHYFLPEKHNCAVDGEKFVIGGRAVHQSSHYAELVIKRILTTGIQDRQDLARVLAWKIGKINHKCTEKKNAHLGDSKDDGICDSISFEYSRCWEKCECKGENVTIKAYGRNVSLDLDSLFYLINENRGILSKTTPMEPDSIRDSMQILRESRIKGIGTVYWITILYFMTHGECPIYDRFAMYALKAGEKRIMPDRHKKVKLQDVLLVPSKEEKKVLHIADVDGFYKQYVELLGETKIDYKKCRNLDRALWVYGHSFVPYK